MTGVTPITVAFIFLCGYALRSAIGTVCLKAHLIRIERRLGVIAAYQAADPDIDDDAEVETCADEGAFPLARVRGVGGAAGNPRA